MEYKAKKDLDVISFPLESAVTMVLKKGRDRIEQGWMKHRYHYYGDFCTLGAIDYMSAGGLVDIGGPSYLAGELLATTAGLKHYRNVDNWIGPIAIWNDTPSRTKEEVLQVFDRAIVKSMECDNAV